jgi:hypothetical protein
MPTDEYLLGLKDGGLTQQQIADKFPDLTLGMVAGTLSRFRSKLKKSGLEYPEDITEYNSTIEIRGDGTQVSDRLILIYEEELKDPDRLLELHNFDPKEWVLTHAKNNLWHAQKSWRFGGGRQIQYQSKITAKPKTGTLLTYGDIDDFFTGYKSAAKSKPIKSPRRKNGVMLEIDLADLHNAATPFEEQEQSTQEKFDYTIDDICRRAKKIDIELITFVPLGDFGHFDTLGKTTARGTQVGGSMTYHALFDSSVNMVISGIDRLREISPVEIKFIPGNHDPTLSYGILKSLEFYYRNTKYVKFDNGHASRKWMVWGKSLIVWTHGDMPKKNITTWLQQEARTEWGQTRYAEVHAAHIHHQITTEKDGLIIRYLPTFAPTDTWHYDRGYVGNVKSTASFVWDKEKGLTDIWYTNI